MKYRFNFESRPNNVSDIFDGAHYQKLLKERVVVDGEELEHHYFSDHRDVALALCTDSYLLYKRRNAPLAMPLLLLNYNIPPTLRTHHKYLICIRIIPGPHHPKNLGSFLSPLDKELAQLACGVPTFDGSEKGTFDLHAYVIMKLGDIPTVQKFLNIKGHNSIFPCRSCKIKAVRGLGKTHYVPLRPPKQSGQGSVSWKAEDLPLRAHQDFLDVFQEIRDAPTKAAKERIAKETGIRGLPGLHRVGSLDYAQSIPWEWFHVLLENIIPNLIDLWTGQFKGLNIGDDEFKIAPHIWEAIGEETTAATEHIPASFVRVIYNVATQHSLFIAESWCFWFVYLAPLLLENRFPKNKYYTHMRKLSELMKLTLQFQITVEQVDDIERRFQKWVEKYEKSVLLHARDRNDTNYLCGSDIIIGIALNSFQLAH